jgi:hypothetical protein
MTWVEVDCVPSVGPVIAPLRVYAARLVLDTRAGVQ